MQTTVVSSPGKVLLAGGYLVLDQHYQGLVVGASARFYCAVTTFKPHNESYLGENTFPVVVQSPQFESGEWVYTLSYLPELKLWKLSENTALRNPFIEIVLFYTFNLLEYTLGHETFVQHWNNAGLKVKVFGDNDFYSQQERLTKHGLPNTTQSLRCLPRFVPTGTTLSKVHKTGLGSSATLVTSLVAALFTHFGFSQTLTNQPGAIDSSFRADFLAWVHTVAQFCHCLAQGKIGSGFDVSAAVYGSHMYRRFNPAVLEPILPSEFTLAKLPTLDLSRLYSTLSPDHAGWDHTKQPMALPPGFRLMLADVDTGSHTPSMVSKVLAWRKAHYSEAQQLWDALGNLNHGLASLIQELTQDAHLRTDAYQLTIDQFTRFPTHQWAEVCDAEPTLHDSPTAAIAQHFVKIANTFAAIRQYLRDMGDQSHVPIEPARQTALLDCCMQVAGVVMAGVPGAGGYDAIFCVVLSDASAKQVENVWHEWKDMNVSPLLVEESKGGVRLEDPDQILTRN
ncbi:phosphomevalonate kinase [Dispira simplex]|nr:phosphomevalonate kinase [Dispira simplex]